MKYNPSFIEVNLTNLIQNYDYISKLVGQDVVVAPAIKANAYGAGAAEVVYALTASRKCKNFFVARLDEALDLKKSVISNDVNIYVLDGIEKGCEHEFKTHNLTPVLNNLHQIEICKNFALLHKQKMPVVVHVDTGINRLGISMLDVPSMLQNQELDVQFFMSHLACADEPEHQLNEVQLKRVLRILQITGSKISFANSAGIFLGQEYHFNMVRPGLALYGLNAVPSKPNIMLPVISIYTKMIHINHITQDEYVGYGASYLAKAGSVLGVIPIGYADGFFRIQSNKGSCFINGFEAKIVGRISMDLTVIDITNIPERYKTYDVLVEVLGPNRLAEDIAQDALTIGYEVLTNIGDRYKRIYKND